MWEKAVCPWCHGSTPTEPHDAASFSHTVLVIHPEPRRGTVGPHWQAAEKLGVCFARRCTMTESAMALSTQNAQKGHPARPQRAKRRGVHFGTLSF